jgi:Spy/CpxP family protein refolding chaperone
MKKMITSALVLALTIGAAQAQTTSTEKEKENRKEHKMHKLDGLNLTEDQKARLKALKEEQKKEMQALEKTGSATKEQKKQLHEKYKAQMEAILMPEQKQQLDKIKEERKTSGKNADFKKSNGNKRNGWDSTGIGRKDFRRGADLQKELGLSQDQQEKIKKIRADFKTQFEAVHNDASLTQDQKRTKFHELMKAQQEQSKSVLSKEQIEKMESLRKERSSKNTK